MDIWGSRRPKTTKKKRRVSECEVQKLQVEVLELKKERLKLEVENAKCMHRKLSLEVHQMETKLRNNEQ